MLRGLATVSYFADDMAAARTWYPKLLGTEPYFERAEHEGRIVGPDDPGFDRSKVGYMEFRIGDYLHELGIIDRRYVPHASVPGPAGVVVYWHFDYLNAGVQRLLAMGATEHEPPTPREAGFVTASVIDPFGNILGVMHNPHYLQILATTGRA
jgi:predicted enzyme related to lactoylglutathione lyase